jgi:hypothetical protein
VKKHWVGGGGTLIGPATNSKLLRRSSVIAHGDKIRILSPSSSSFQKVILIGPAQTLDGHLGPIIASSLTSLLFWGPAP